MSKSHDWVFFFPHHFTWYFECQHQWKVFAFWATECQPDSPQSPCHKESCHHPHNYSNWAAAGDSSSCLLPVGLNNQTLVQRFAYAVSMLLGGSRFGCEGFMNTAGFSSRVLRLPRLQLLRLTRLQTCRSSRYLFRNKKSQIVLFLSIGCITLYCTAMVKH